MITKPSACRVIWKLFPESKVQTAPRTVKKDPPECCQRPSRACGLTLLLVLLSPSLWAKAEPEEAAAFDCIGLDRHDEVEFGLHGTADRDAA